MLIKHKLIVNAVILFVSMGFMLLLLTFASNSFQKDIEIATTIGDIKSSILQLRRHEKDFIARKQIKYQQKFNQEFKTLNQTISQLDNELKKIGLTLTETQALQKITQQYQQHFTSLVQAQKTIGLTHKNGLYGALRKTVHEVESLIGTKNYPLLSSILQLRRHEKDFMLRQDISYYNKFNTTLNSLILQLQQNKFMLDNSKQIISLLTNYQQAFSQLVKQQQYIGLTPNQGLLGKMRNTIHQVDNVLNQLVTKTKAEVIEYVQFINFVGYSLTAIILFIACLITWLLGRSILSAIIELKDVIVKIAKTNDLTLHVNTKNNDELGDMARSFNAMLANFRALIAQVNNSVNAVNDATKVLSQNITIANQGVEQQKQETDMVATAVTEMVATVEEIANNTHDAADKAESANKNAIQGKQGVSQTIEQIQRLSATLNESESAVQDLARDSETIGSVIDVIRSIAEQTNLLALNAAIEAARAGEQGRGFAVVADEVRTLASRTQESTQEIESIINSLQGRTQNIVQLMSTCRNQGDESVYQANSAGKKLEEITENVSLIMDMNTTIAAAIEEQSTVAAEVNKHVVLIRDVAEQAESSAQQNAQMSEELTQQAQSLNNEVSRFVV